MVAGLPPLIGTLCGVFFCTFWGTYDNGKYTCFSTECTCIATLPDWTADVYHTEVFEKAFEALSGWIFLPYFDHLITPGQW